MFTISVPRASVKGIRTWGVERRLRTVIPDLIRNPKDAWWAWFWILAFARVTKWGVEIG